MELKKAGCIFLVLLLFLQSGGLLFILNVQQGFLFYEMHERLNNPETVFEKITLTQKDYEDSRVNTDEILYNGNMYDVKSILIINNTVELLAINDVDEFEVFKIVENLIACKDLPVSEISFHLQKLISLFYVSFFDDLIFHLQASTTNYLPLLKLNRQILFAEIPCPPPRLF